MTLPNERTRAVSNAKRFLRDLLDPKKTPRVPKDVRRQAYYVLKHFPANYELRELHQHMPETFGPLEEKDSDENY